MRGLALTLSLLVGACSLPWDDLDPREATGASGGASTTSGGGHGGLGGTGGSGGTGGATSSSSSVGGSGGAGGMENGGGGAGGVVDDCAGGHEDPATGHCYLVADVPLDWMAARSECQQEAADLVGISTSQEYTFIVSFLTEQGPYWIGGHDMQTTGVYEWINGEPWGFEPWEPGEPNQEGTAHCLDIYDSSVGPLFGDNNCTNVSRFICERAPRASSIR